MTKKKSFTKSCVLPIHLHSDLMKVAEEEKSFFQDQLEQAVSLYLRNRNNQKLYDNSVLGDILYELKRTEERIAGMIAKFGISTETSVELLLDALTQNQPDEMRKKIYESARSRGARRFASRVTEKVT